MAPELLREGHRGCSPGLFPVGNYRVGLKTTGKVGRARFGVWIIRVFLLHPTRSSLANSFSCCTKLDFIAGYTDKNISWGSSCWMEQCWGLGSGAGGKKMGNQQWEKPDWPNTAPKSMVLSQVLCSSRRIWAGPVQILRRGLRHFPRSSWSRFGMGRNGMKPSCR